MAVRDRRLPELAVFVLAAVLHTWPLASAPGMWTRVDNADTALNTWASVSPIHRTSAVKPFRRPSMAKR